MLPLPPNGKKFLQGIFTPKHPERYIGKEKPRYLSSLELKFFRWCDSDHNTNIKEWASESIIIPYLNPIDNRYHKYYTDAVLALQEGDQVQKYIIEIKPEAQTRPPIVGKQRKKTLVYESHRWVQNNAKWGAATAWSKQHGYLFQILTEKNLN